MKQKDEVKIEQNLIDYFWQEYSAYYLLESAVIRTVNREIAKLKEENEEIEIKFKLALKGLGKSVKAGYELAIEIREKRHSREIAKLKEEIATLKQQLSQSISREEIEKIRRGRNVRTK